MDCRDAHGRLSVCVRTSHIESTEAVDLAAACAVCGASTLHRWFYLGRAEELVSFCRAWQGPGSQWQWQWQWQWGSTCHSYEHASGLVPDWWNPPCDMALDSLMHDEPETGTPPNRDAHRPL
jgi:hypothetical protein